MSQLFDAVTRTLDELNDGTCDCATLTLRGSKNVIGTITKIPRCKKLFRALLLELGRNEHAATLSKTKEMGDWLLRNNKYYIE